MKITVSDPGVNQMSHEEQMEVVLQVVPKEWKDNIETKRVPGEIDRRVSLNCLINN